LCRVWQEVVAALRGGCRIIPVTDEAFMWPDEDSLPLDIRAVARYQAIPSVLDHTVNMIGHTALLICPKLFYD